MAGIRARPTPPAQLGERRGKTGTDLAELFGQRPGRRRLRPRRPLFSTLPAPRRGVSYASLRDASSRTEPLARHASRIATEGQCLASVHPCPRPVGGLLPLSPRSHAHLPSPRPLVLAPFGSRRGRARGPPLARKAAPSHGRRDRPRHGRSPLRRHGRHRARFRWPGGIRPPLPGHGHLRLPARAHLVAYRQIGRLRRAGGVSPALPASHGRRRNLGPERSRRPFARAPSCYHRPASRAWNTEVAGEPERGLPRPGTTAATEDRGRGELA